MASYKTVNDEETRVTLMQKENEVITKPSKISHSKLILGSLVAILVIAVVVLTSYTVYKEIASPDAALNLECEKPEQLKDGAWICSEDGSSCHPACRNGFKSNPKTIMECYQTKWIPNSNNFLCEFDPEYKPLGSIVIESSGQAAEHQGYRLGYFDESSEKLNKRPYYIQRGGHHFLYYHRDQGMWCIGTTLGGPTVSLKIKSYADLPPPTGWSYYDGGKWVEASGIDNTLKVTIDPPELTGCNNIQVESTGPAGTVQSKYMGLYKQMARQWLNGRRVYHNGYAYLRVRTGGTTWAMGVEKDSATCRIDSGRATMCPCIDETGPSIRYGREWWRYWDGSKWVIDPTITVMCV